MKLFRWLVIFILMLNIQLSAEGIIPSGGIADAGLDQNICSNNATVNGNDPSGFTSLWLVVNGTATINNPNATSTTITEIVGSSVTLAYQFFNGVDLVSSDEVIITIDENPSAADAGIDQTICSTSASLSANTPTFGTGLWTVISGTAIFDNATSPTSGVSVLSVGNNVLRWTISNGTCNESFDEIAIQVGENPTTAEAGIDQTVCATTSTLSANTPTFGTGLWTVISGTAIFDNSTSPTSGVSGLSVGNNVLRWTISNGTCNDSFDEIAIQVDENPTTADAGIDQTICATSASLSANTPTFGTGLWTVISGAAIFSNANLANTSASGLSVGNNILRWTISNGTCADSFDEIAIQVDENPTTADAGTDQTICSTTASLSANSPTIGTGLWTVISGTATFDNATSPTSGVSGLSVGNNVLRWTISNGVCAASFDNVTINFQDNPLSPDAGTDQTICSPTTTLSATAASGGVWSVIAGTGTFTNENLANTSVTALSTGTNTFRWTIPGGACADVFDEVNIDVDQNPTTAEAGTDQTICSTSTSFSANSPIIGTGLWTVISGTAIFDNATSPTSGVSGLSVGNNVFHWTTSNGTCNDSFDEIAIQVDENPTTADAGIDQTICATVATLSANSPTIGTGLWTVISGTATFDNATSPTSGVSGLSVGNNVFRWTISNGTCNDSFDNVTINVQDNPLSPNAGTDQTICSSITTLAATSAAGGVWSVISGTGTFVNASLANTSVSSLSTGTNTFRWTIPGGACADVFDEVSIIVQAAQTTANAGTDQTICATVATLSANSPTIGTGLWTVISGTATFDNSTSPASGVSGLSVGNNVLRWTISNGTCNDSFDEIAIQVDENPTTAEAGIDQTVCATTSTLSANTPTFGTGLWTVISGTAIFDNSTSPTSGISGLSVGNNVLRWTISNGTCNDSFDEIAIQVDENPTSADAGTDQTICSTTASLSANSPTIGTGLWSVISGTAIFDNATSPTSGVSGLSVANNVLRWAISNGVCAASFDNITINVQDNPLSPNAGTDQTICSSTTTLAATAASGGVWSVIFGTGTFTNENLANTSVSELSTGTNTFRWTIPGGACADVFDEVSVIVQAAPTTANAGTDQTICSTVATLSANSPIIGNGLWSVISGTAIFDNATSPTSGVSGLSVGNNVLRWTISNGVCAASFDNVTINVQDNPLSPNAGTDQTICSSTTTLAATSAAGGVWSVIFGTGTFVNASLANTSVSSLSTGTNTFRWTIPGGACADVFDEVSIIVQAAPTTANAGTDQTICSTVATLAANSPSVGTGLWSVISGTAIFDNATSPTSGVSGLSVGNNVLRWTISNGVCAASFDNVTINVQDNPLSPNAGTDQTICSSTTTLAATAANGGVWSVIAGTGTFANASLANTSVTALSTGTNTFRWTIPGGACADVFDDVSIIVQAAPTSANAGTDQTICSTVATLSANSPIIGTGLWSVISGTAIFDNSTSPTSGVSGLSIGTNTFRWTISNGVCAASFDNVTINVQDNPLSPNAGADQTTCSSSTNLSATAVTGGIWSIIAGTGTFTNENLANTSVSGLSTGTNTFRWTIPGGACADVFDDVSIIVQAAPTTANAGIDQTICSTVATLSANLPIIGTGLWTVISGTAIFDNATSPTSGVSGLSVGNNILRWTISNGVCAASFDNVTINVQDNPLSPNAGTDQTICSPTTTLNATAAAGGVWSVISGTGTFANASLANSSVTGLSTGTNTFRWTIPGGACADVFDEVSIIVQAAPTTANAGIDQTICSTVSTLSANLPIIGTGLWTLISGNAIFDNATSPTSGISGLTVGNNVLRWIISNGVCAASFDNVTINVQDNPLSPNAGTDQTICSNNTTLAATASSGGVWSVIAGTGTFVNASLSSSSVTGLSAGTNTFRWTIPGGACADVFDEVNVVVQAAPTTANAGTDQTICSTVATLAANSPTIGNGLWSIVSGTAIFDNATSPTSGVSGLSVGNNILRWTISNGVCAASFDNVTINVQDNPLSPNAGTDQTICSPTTTLSATAASGGVWSVIAGTGTFANASLANTNVSELSTGTNTFRWTIPGEACADVFDDVSIIVQAAPTSANAGTDQTICSTVATLSANSPIIGTGLWSVISGTAIFDNATSPASGLSGLSVGTNTFRWTISNGVCAASFDNVTINVQDNPLSPNAGTDQTICSSTTTLNATSAAGGVWSVISGTGTFVNASLANTSVSSLSTGTNTFRWTIPGGACADVFDEVSVIVQAAPTTANAGIDQTICSTVATLAANSPIIGTGLWTVVSGTAIFDNATSPTSGVSGLSVGNNVLRWTISNGVCAASFEDVTLILENILPPSNAGIDQTICNSVTETNATLNASPSINGTWSLISGNGTFGNVNLPNTSISGLAVGLNILRWTVTNGVCPSSSDDVSITVQQIPTTANAGVSQSSCNTSINLIANTPLIGTGVWSIISGNAIIQNPNLSNSVVTFTGTGLLTLRWTISNGVCPVSFDEISYNISTPPISDAGNSQLLCVPSTSLNANTPLNAAGIWTLIQGQGIIQSPTSPNTQISNLGIGINIFQWEVDNGICQPVSSQVTITRFQEPSSANAGTDLNTCATSSLINADIPLIGEGFWFITSGSGTILDPTSPNTAVSGLNPGLNTLIWSVSNGTCNASSDTLNIIVDQNPITANAGLDQQICGATSALSASAITAGTGTWTLISGAGNILLPNEPIAAITNIGVGANVFRWSVVNGTCSSFDEVVITRFLPPSAAVAGNDQTLCANLVNLNGNNPSIGSGTWSIITGGGIIASPNSATSQVTNLAAGVNTFAWTVTNGACPSTSDQVAIVQQQNPSQANAGIDVQICSDLTQLSATNPSIGTGVWSLISGNATIQNATSYNSNVTNLGEGTTIFQWTTINGICPTSTDQVTITRFLPPTVANAGLNISSCDTFLVLNANNASIGTGTWEILSGNAQLENESNPNTQIYNLSEGSISLQWTISNGPCPITFDEVTIEVFPQPNIAFLEDDIAICGDSILLEGSDPGTNTIQWNFVIGNGTFEDATAQQTNVLQLTEGNNVISYSLSSGPCVSRDTIVIETRFPTQFVFAGNDTSICADILQLNGSVPAFGQGVWSIVFGEPAIENDSLYNSLVELAPDSTILEWTVYNGICDAVSDTIIIFRDQLNEEALAIGDGIYCADSILIEGGNEIGFWQIISGDAEVEDPANNFTSLIFNTPGEAIVEWVVSSLVCTSSDTVYVESSASVGIVYAGPDISICGNEFQLEGLEPQIGQGLWTVEIGNLLLQDSSNANSTITEVEEGFYRLRWTVTNGACVESDLLFLTFNALPTAEAGLDFTACINDTSFTQANIPDIGTTQWTILSGSAIVNDGENPNTSIIPLEEGVIYMQWNVKNGFCKDSDLVVITVLGPDDPFCAGPDVEVFVPEGFSPNGDGKFDFLEIVKPPTKRLDLEVFNRNGVIVFKSNDYQNDWNGIATAGTILQGTQLPEGTYYYKATLEDQKEPILGYITLWR